MSDLKLSVELTEARAGMNQRASSLVRQLDSAVGKMHALGMLMPSVHVYPKDYQTLCAALNTKRRKHRLPPRDNWQMFVQGVELREYE